MDKEVREALEGSIEKWRKICEEGGGDQGIANCPLCDLSHDSTHCYDCPVSDVSFRYGCENTPYIDWYNHHVAEHGLERRLKVKCDECQNIAERELEFLKSLREEEKDA